MSSANGLRRSRLGLGCVTFGREIDRAASFAMLDHAMTLGWTHLDTASAYGGGASEKVLGEWLVSHGLHGRVTVATKVLPPYSAAAIESSVAQSLQRLQTDTLDLLYLHRWHATAEAEEVPKMMDALMRQGRVRAFALSNFDAAQLNNMVKRSAAAGGPPLRALQNVNNLALPAIDAETRRVCAAHDIAIVTYSPLGAGFLTGKYAAGIPAGSRFDVIPGHQPLYFTPFGQARQVRLQQVAARTGIPAADLALAWALHQPQITTVLVGGRTPAHLDQAERAAKLDIPDVLEELSAE